MKITPKQYGEALYQAVKGLPAGKAGKKDSQVKSGIENFIKVLVSNNDISKLDKIVEQFGKIWNREESIVEAEITSARELDKKIIKLLNGYIAELSEAEKIILKQSVNKNILGGVIIKYEDKVLDGSLRMKLEALKINMIK